MSSLPSKKYYPRKKPVRAFMGCGCIMNLSNRQRSYGEAWCYVHRARVAVVSVLEPAKKSSPEGMTPLL